MDLTKISTQRLRNLYRQARDRVYACYAEQGFRWPDITDEEYEARVAKSDAIRLVLETREHITPPQFTRRHAAKKNRGSRSSN